MLVNCNELFEIIFACSKIGAIFVPINSRFIAREIKHVLNNSEASVFIHDARFSEEVQKVLEKDSSIKTVVTVGDNVNQTIMYESFIATQSIKETIQDIDLNRSRLKLSNILN